MTKVLSGCLVVGYLPVVAGRIPLFLPLKDVQLLAVFFSFYVVFIRPTLTSGVTRDPRLFSATFALRRELSVPSKFIRERVICVSVLLNALILYLFFFFVRERVGGLERESQRECLRLLRNVLSGLPVTTGIGSIGSKVHCAF